MSASTTWRMCRWRSGRERCLPPRSLIMARAVIALVALFAVTTWVHSQDPPPRVQALGLEIRKPLPPGVDSELEDFRPQGTTIRLVIDLPDKHIVDVDPEASKVSHFKDDKGSDLLKADKASGLGRDDWLWAHFLRVSKNGKQCSIEPSAPGVPAVGATKVKLKGIIVLLCGSEEKSVEAKDVV